MAAMEESIVARLDPSANVEIYKATASALAQALRQRSQDQRQISTSGEVLGSGAV